MKKYFVNASFLIVCGGILFFLLNAPEKSTTPLPYNDKHKKFFSMQKKEAEKFCLDCHGEDKMKPLPADHPTKQRCLFCHTRDIPNQ